MKNRSANILIVALLLLVMMSVILIVFLEKAHEEFPENITVEANGVTESILPIRDLRLTPTEAQEYSVNLVCEASGSYYIFLDYEETVDGGMKPFVDVTITCGDLVVYTGSLEDLFKEDNILQFEGNLESKEKPPLVLTFRYEMPHHVGNEAQGTYSDFDVHIKIKKS